jgi:CRISPR-associated protein Cas1
LSYHIVNIDRPECHLTCRDGQLTCKSKEGERGLPLEDVAAIVVTSFSASIHSNLFLQAAKHGVSLIICESFKPVSLVLPANRSSDTLLTRALVNLSPRVRQKLWDATIDCKCLNQALLAESLLPTESCTALRASALSRKAHKEAICAKLYWQILAQYLNIESFNRGRNKGGLNQLLNYGYAVLLSTVLQKLFAVGLDPTFGIAHVTRERSAPLAYDLMEPFRPCVDVRVVQWLKEHPESYEVTPEFRRWVTAFPIAKVEYMNLHLEIRGCIEGVVRSFRRAVLAGQASLYKPWTPKNSKWVG